MSNVLSYWYSTENITTQIIPSILSFPRIFSLAMSIEWLITLYTGKPAERSNAASVENIRVQRYDISLFISYIQKKESRTEFC